MDESEKVGALAPSRRELDQIWQRNASVLDQMPGLVHDLISEVAAAQPGALAVCAWDGDLTYRQLDELSTSLARRLVGLGAAPRSTVPVLFPKSRWTSVAMLAVVKAGCSAVALDGTQPDSRLRSIVGQTRPPLVVAAAKYRGRAAGLAGGVPVVQLDDSFLEAGAGDAVAKLPAVSASDTVYISFTSGTTGQPKGACISHANVRSAVHYQGRDLGFSRESRVFDFAPYSFDVAWSNFLHTLCAGGCLCVASEDDMLADLSAAISAMGATLINITPTVLRTIRVVPPSLQSGLLSGEMPYRDNVTQWAGRVRLVNTYGPTECTFKCAFSEIDPAQQDRPHLGKGAAFALWIVDPADATKLAPLGSVGELYLEGPLVGQGYLADPDKTASAFVHDPPWLLAGSSTHPGRRGRLYKTGDLFRYDPRGNLVFVGRKDTSQLKIRGQRVEIGDVEHHVRAVLDDALPIIVDVVTPLGADAPLLVLFVATGSADAGKVRNLMDGLAEELRGVLPAFMIPSAYLPVDEIPVAATGKADRRRLRELGSAMSWQQIVQLQSTVMSARDHREPSNDAERRLRQIWADVLSLDASCISTNDGFLRLGGDSISAMRVVAAARAEDMSTTVADLFQRPTLAEVVEAARPRICSPDEEPVLPFTLLKGARDPVSICQDVASLCGVASADVEDVYPCTPLQEGMLATSAKSAASQTQSDATNYISRVAYELPAGVDLAEFEEAWARTVQRASIMRTRIVDIPSEGLVQVLIRRPVPLERFSSVDEFLQTSTPMGLATPLCRSGVVVAKSSPRNLLLLEMHHAIFDGWVTKLIIEALESALVKSTPEKPLAPFQAFIRHVLASDTPEAAAFWQNQLADSTAAQFPPPPPPSHQPCQKLDLSHAVRELQWAHRSGITPSSVVRSALALLLASHTNSSEVVFGATVSGRTAPLNDIESIAGPTIATVPVRVRLDWDQTARALQQQVQQQALDVNRHEQYGLSRIRRINDEASRFQLLLVVQPGGRDRSGLFGQAKSIVRTADDAGSDDVQLVAKDGDMDSVGMHNPYAMMIICQLQSAGLVLRVNYDPGAVETAAVGRMCVQLEQLIRQLCDEQLAESTLRSISPITKQDLGQIWRWNRAVPKAAVGFVTSMIDEWATTNPDGPAVASWDRTLTYRQLRDLSEHLAYRLLHQGGGVGPGSLVVLNFDKSSWLLVCMMATLKMGATALPLSSPATTHRALEIIEAVQPKLVLTSGPVEESPFYTKVPTMSVSDLTPNEEWLHVPEPHTVTPSDPALILFTSGSTGTPKSILWSHETLSSNICAARDSFGITAQSRVLQFAGYEFDVSTVESLAVLSAGGTLCIPSEADRTNRLGEAVNEFQASWVCLTPSVSETLDPRELSSLKTLVFAGEKLQRKTASRWVGTLEAVYNWYGPAEASVATCCLLQKSETWDSSPSPLTIGKSSSGGLVWLVDPKDRNLLSPIGAVSELCIEGPIVAQYAGQNSLRLNEESFFSPRWLQEGHEELEMSGREARLYQTGDLVRYDGCGRVVFLGRKHESQRKLRGQRVELGEIELRVHEFLAGRLEATVVAEIFCPDKSDKETLALFVSPLSLPDDAENVTDHLKRALPVDELEQALLESLPPHMIPKVYVPLAKMLTNHSGKTDRRRLRHMGSSLARAELAAMQPSRRVARQPSTAMERRLQQLWADVIGIEAGAIHAGDNFLRLGGDSITAMRLVASARHQGLALTVADVFRSPLLEDMAECVRYDDESDSSGLQMIAPFSLLGPEVDEAAARRLAARAYPERLVVAWSATVANLPLLRTRIIDLPGQGLVQVVLDDLPLQPVDDLDAFLRRDQETPMGLGTELCRAAIVDRNFALTMHHCTYDGNTLKMILEELERQYLGRPGLSTTPFRNFIHHVGKMDKAKSAEFWKQQLSGSEAAQFPALPRATYKPQADQRLQHDIALTWPRAGVTPSTVARSAWALLAAQHTRCDDVLFAVTVSGRQAGMRGIESCAGPTICTIPVAVRIDWAETIGGFLARRQSAMAEATAHEQLGLQNIYRAAGDGLDPRHVQTLLVVQPVAEGRALDRDGLLFRARCFASSLDTLGVDPFNNYPLQVVCELRPDGMQLRVSFDAGVLDPLQVRRMAGQFETVLRQLCDEGMAALRLGAIQTASDEDLAVFWAQNAQVPRGADVLVHDSIALAAKAQPGSTAVDAWDGRFTYRELDELSTQMAHALAGMGVVEGSVVAICSEKSKWVPLVQVAVYKAGGVTVLQSVAVPELRMAKVFERIGVKLAVVSESRLEVMSRHARCCTIDQLLRISSPDSQDTTQQPAALPLLKMSSPAAILVSSGSTGEPKQVLWSHGTLSSNAKAHGEYLGVNAGTRVLQFASYDFDVSTIETASTLVHAGCLCIPSEAERLDGLGGAINRLRTDFVNITPSTAKALRPEDVAGTLRTLVLSGENLAGEDVRRWKGTCPVLNWYGPAEHPATVLTASDESWYTGVIGQVGSRQPALCWLVDPEHPDRLVPFGTVGEIALEGPLGADGYVANDAMTRQRFRETPRFLAAGHGEVPGRQGRVYYSGDLGRYDSAGNLVYMGRKDAQLKIRGQLVAPEEVEAQIRTWLNDNNNSNNNNNSNSNNNSKAEVVVDVVSRAGSKHTLVAYITAETAELELMTSGLTTKLEATLPRYAVPSYYIPVPAIPTNASGKKDRKRLREIGSAYEPPRSTPASGRWEPTTTAERTLRELWSTVLKMDPEAISAGDSFLRVGDSIQAMRLVGLARQQGLVLTVADVFEHPVLEDMAKCVRNRVDKDGDDEDGVAPFTLLRQGSDHQAVRREAAEACGVDEDDVQDVFPCTPLQEGLLALTIKSPGAYTGRNTLQLAPAVDLDRFKQSWEEVCAMMPILRTRIVHLPDQGLVQVVIREKDCWWTDAADVEQYISKDQKTPMGLGSRLVRCAVISGAASESGHGCFYFALTMHHSVYDGLTMPAILEALENIYHGSTPLQPLPFQTFVKYIQERDKEAEATFWKSQFSGLEAAPFPSLPAPDYEPATDSQLTHHVADVSWRADDASPSTTLRAAFALLCSRYFSSADVVFGAVVAGRKAPVGGIERVVGPTIATLPVRVRLDAEATVLRLLEAVQRQATDMIPWEQAGLSYIRQLGEEASRACQFQTLLVVQPGGQQTIQEGGLFVSEAEHQRSDSGAFDSYALSLVCTLEAGRLSLDFRFDSRVVDRDTIERAAHHLEHLVKRLCTPELDQTPLGEVTLTTDRDLNQIWKWNAEDFARVDACVHDLVSQAARAHPQAVAVSAWDGEVRYHELDAVSTVLAARLVEMGVVRNTVVPLVFEKSMYGMVALLSVLKAGAGVLLLDSTLPESRLQAIITQTNPAVVVSSVANQDLTSRLVQPTTKTMPLGPDSYATLRGTTRTSDLQLQRCLDKLPRVAPSDLLYAVFTSGSTGTPKGCQIEHGSFCSAVVYQERVIAPLRPGARVYDLSSYSFDASIWMILRSLAAGATLCVPSEQERRDDLEGSMRRFRTTDVAMTPSTARLLHPPRLPTLRHLHVGGEAVTRADAARWTPYATVFVGYGPSECNAAAVWYRVPAVDAPSPLPIGKGTGVSTWVLDPASSERLMPVGAVGELYLQGPLVGRGYLGDHETTAAAFIDSPGWLVRGSPDGSVPGRSGARLYKTGDLVRYNADDGSLVFLGRKDAQVKLRGQRIELGEVEHHLRQCLAAEFAEPSVAAEVVVPAATGSATLAAFVQIPAGERPRFQEAIRGLEDALKKRLPTYMVPSAYIPLEAIPLAPSGKTDRKALRGLGVGLTLEQLDGGDDADENAEVTGLAIRLREMWAALLPVPIDKIRATSSFLRVGGDSISAMRLAALARTGGFSLSVANILRNPVLCKMAETMANLRQQDGDLENMAIPAFSLLKTTKDAALAVLTSQCRVEASQIQDAFPCTGVQKSLLSMTAKSEGSSYIARFLLRLRPGTDARRLRQAWEEVSRTAAPILRYRIVDLPREGLVQVQIDEALEWDAYESVEACLGRDGQRGMGLGDRLTRLALVQDEEGPCCVLTQHHAIYDGYSMDLLLDQVARAYAGTDDESPLAPFQAFVKEYVVDANQQEARDFWRAQFAESEAVPFPALPSADYRPRADSTVKRHIGGLAWPKRNATASTVIRAAWSVLTSRYTDSHDVVFGAMVTGRQGSLPGIGRMIAPLINAVPVRVRLDPAARLEQLLDQLQSQAVAMIPHEHTEVLDIRRLGGAAEQASRFNTLLVVQPAGRPEYTAGGADGPFAAAPESLSSRDGLDDFNPNAVMIMCQLARGGEVDVELSFDSGVIAPAQMARLAAQFEHVLRQFCSSGAATVRDVDLVSPQDLAEVWRWNAQVPAAVPRCVHELVEATARRQPDDCAVCAWDGSLSYSELEALSRRLALHLVALGVGRGTTVPLCFEKSVWYPVAALAVMRAGGACLAMDSTQPEARLRSIVQQVGPKLILSSASTEELASRLSDDAVVLSVDAHKIKQLPETTSDGDPSLPKTSPTDVLYIVFTSGSTGVPKGIVTTHQNFASAAAHQADMLHIRRGTRVFDFVSYNFDVSWSNHLQTLISGGCLCIPSESDRRNDIAGAFNRLRCDYSYFTPSVAKSLDPSALPGLRTLAMGGEPIQNTEVARWTSAQVETVIGIYGPAECAQALTFALLTPATRNNHVGRPYGANVWLVEPGRPDRLAGVGTTAELAIEGPTLSSGYFGDAAGSAAYVETPAWLSRGAEGHAPRRGTVYMTGDLARYGADGSLDFIGRKDALVKLRGQRVELAEVEYHVAACLREGGACVGIAAEIVTPKNGSSPILTVFLSVGDSETPQETEPQETEARLVQILQDLEQLPDRVPQYMVPGAYISIPQIPMTTTNKTDRRALRELGGSKTLEELTRLQLRGRDRRAPDTPMERRLRDLWSAVLQIDPANIGADSSFLRIGGESIAAMRLVAAARAAGLSLTVAHIFKAPRLCDLALLVKEVGGGADEQIPRVRPFALLKTQDPEGFVERYIAPAVEGGRPAVQDVVPATDFQEQSVADALQDPPGRYPHWTFDLPADVDFTRLRQACVELANHYDILRSVFVRAEGRLWQVVLASLDPVYDTIDAGDAGDADMATLVNSVCEQDIKRPRVLGRSFIRFIAVKHASGRHKFIFRISHAQFDGFSWASVLETLWSIYRGDPPAAGPSFTQYVAHAESTRAEAQSYWRSLLRGSPAPVGTRPNLLSAAAAGSSSNLCSPANRLTVKETIAVRSSAQDRSRDGASLATLFHAACALVLARRHKLRQVVFGRLVTGRSMLPGRLQEVVGPTMAEVPIRAVVEADDTVAAVAARLQAQFIEGAAHEAVGMVRIIEGCTGWAAEGVPDFGWRTAFQQPEDGGSSFLGRPSGVGFYEGAVPSRVRSEIYATPVHGDRLELEFEGNKRFVSEEDVREVFAGLRDALS
ncbi:NRPS [Pyricularia oryzae]|nr:NRPS [Pyricularia oryzae]